MNIAVIGLSHKTAPVEVREKLSIPEALSQQALAHLKGYPHIEEVAILSTCNRLEIYIVSKESDGGVTEVRQFLSEWSKLALYQLRPFLFILLHEDAVTHIMRVAAGLDSLVLGEGQILAQVKQTHKLGQQFNSVGPVLNRLFKQALTAGKRVRTETSIGTGAVSISSAAVELASMKVEAFYGLSLADCKVMILGAGKMSRLLVQHLIGKGVGEICIVNRSAKRSEELAGQFPDNRLRLLPLTDMMRVIGESHLVFTSTGATEPLLNRAKLESNLGGECRLMLIDISVPRNVDGDVNQMKNIVVYNVDDLKAVVAQNQESRRQMALEAAVILDQEVGAFDEWWRSLETVPTINCLRNKMELIRSQELEKALSRLGSEFAEKHQDIIEGLTRGIINKILHDPMVQLRAQQDIEARKRAMQALQVLFNLDMGEQYS